MPIKIGRMAVGDGRGAPLRTLSDAADAIAARLAHNRSMETEEKRPVGDPVLAAAKQPGQARCRALVASGARTQESCFLIPRDVALAATVHHRVLSFD